jgi:hypothetical protein
MSITRSKVVSTVIKHTRVARSALSLSPARHKCVQCDYETGIEEDSGATAHVDESWTRQRLVRVARVLISQSRSDFRGPRLNVAFPVMTKTTAGGVMPVTGRTMSI